MNEQPSQVLATRDPQQVDPASGFHISLRTLVTLISVAGVFLWLLFELQRMPYRPPFDMRTFLGAPELAFVRGLMLLIAVPEVILIAWFLVRVSLQGDEPRTMPVKFLRCLPTLTAGLLLTFAVGHVLQNYVALQMRLEDAGVNIWEPLPMGTMRSAKKIIKRFYDNRDDIDSIQGP